jgi:hypothetical protein
MMMMIHSSSRRTTKYQLHLMEQDDLEYHDFLERMPVTNFHQAQIAIADHGMEYNIPYHAVPDALVIFKNFRMHLSRDNSFLFWKSFKFVY